MAEHEHAGGPVCPECGASRAIHTPDAPWWWRRRAWIQAAGVLLLAAVMAWKVWNEWPAPAPPVVRASGATSAHFPDQRVTRSRLERVASGASDEPILQLLGIAPQLLLSGHELTAAFVAPSGYVQEFRRYGWPVPFLVYRYDATFDDVYARTNAQPAASRGYGGWRGLRHTRELVNDHDIREIRIVDLGALAPVLLLLAVSWSAGCGLRSVARLAGITRRQGSRRRDRAARRLPMLALALAAVLIATLSSVEQRESPAPLPDPWMPPTAPTGLDTRDLLALRDEPGGNRVLARAILDAADTLRPTGDTLLLGWNSPTPFAQSQISGGWPPGFVNGIRIWRTVPGSPGPARIECGWDRGYLSVTRHTDSHAVRYEQLTLSLAHLAGPLLMLWGAGLGVGLAARVGWLRLRRRALARAAAGRCARCDYELPVA